MVWDIFCIDKPLRFFKSHFCFGATIRFKIIIKCILHQKILLQRDEHFNYRHNNYRHNLVYLKFDVIRMKVIRQKKKYFFCWGSQQSSLSNTSFNIIFSFFPCQKCSFKTLQLSLESDWFVHNSIISKQKKYVFFR